MADFENAGSDEGQANVEDQSVNSPVGNTEQSADNGIPNQPAETTSSQVSPAKESGHNPAWDGVLSGIPKEFHGKLTPAFQEWDQNFRAVNEKYAPYKGIMEAGHKPEFIQNAIGLAQFLQTNPRGLFDELNARYNFMQAQAAAKDPEEFDPRNSADEDELDERSDFEKKIEAQLAEIQQAEEVRAQAQAEETADKQIQAEINDSETLLGHKFSETEFQIVHDRAVARGDFSVKGATQDLISAGFLKPTNKMAPETHSGNGLPTPTRPKLDGSNDAAGIAQMMRDLGLAK